jgi:hypothetical protein
MQSWSITTFFPQIHNNTIAHSWGEPQTKFQ